MKGQNVSLVVLNVRWDPVTDSLIDLFFLFKIICLEFFNLTAQGLANL